MTKSELITIIQKIQNRCYLEAPTKITYYWNDQGQVVFKAFFESLFLPESLRIDDLKIQKSFLTQSTYLYEDDFRITNLDLDEGYLEFIPDDQHFKIINTYKDVQDDSSKDESVRLAGKRLNENFIKNKGYILYEGEKVDVGESSKIRAAKASPTASDTQEKKTQKITDKDVHLISCRLPACLDGVQFLTQCLQDLVKSSVDSTKKLLLIGTSADSYEKYPRFTSQMCKNITSTINLVLGGKESVAYFLSNNIAATQEVLARTTIKNITVENTNFEDLREIISKGNYPNLRTAFDQQLPQIESRLKGRDARNDPTKDIFEGAVKLATELVDEYKRCIRVLGGVRYNTAYQPIDEVQDGWLEQNAKKLGNKLDQFASKSWNSRKKVRDELEKQYKHIFQIAIALCKDIYEANGATADQDVVTEKHKTAQENLKGVGNVASKSDSESFSAKLEKLASDAVLHFLGVGWGSSKNRDKGLEGDSKEFVTKTGAAVDTKEIEHHKIKLFDAQYEADFSIFISTVCKLDDKLLGKGSDFTINIPDAGDYSARQKFMDLLQKFQGATDSINDDVSPEEVSGIDDESEEVEYEEVSEDETEDSEKDTE